MGTDDKGYVVSLSLRHDHEIKGTLPAELGDLTYLRTLDIRASGGFSPSRYDEGSLEGGIPKELGNLSHLSSLIINGLDGTGSIPSELFNLTNLRMVGPFAEPADRGDPRGAGDPDQPARAAPDGKPVQWDGSRGTGKPDRIAATWNFLRGRDPRGTG